MQMAKQTNDGIHSDLETQGRHPKHGSDTPSLLAFMGICFIISGG